MLHTILIISIHNSSLTHSSDAWFGISGRADFQMVVDLLFLLLRSAHPEPCRLLDIKVLLILVPRARCPDVPLDLYSIYSFSLFSFLFSRQPVKGRGAWRELGAGLED